MGRYSHFVVKYPYLLIILDVILAAVTGPIAMHYYGFPDFSDPGKGFESRGTEISGWRQTSVFLWDDVKSGNLTFFPAVSQPERRKRSVQECQTCASDTLQNAMATPRAVITSTYGGSLFSANHLQAICEIENEFLRPDRPDPCDAHSLPRYVSALRNKSCEEINTDDVTAVDDLVTRCAGFYFSGDLHEACVDSPVCSAAVPAECHQYDAVYKLLQYLTDSGYMTNGDTSLKHVTYSMIFLREDWFEGDKNLTDFFFSRLDGKDTSGDLVAISALEFLISKKVLKEYVIQDLPWYALAMALVVIVLLIYLRSLVLMLVVVLNVVFTISISYFIYFFVCRMVFFPFMNLLTGLLLIAVGADDVFILYDIWRQSHRQTPEATCEALVSKMLSHGASSVFVTSLTTAAALFANLISDITAIRCFGIFAGVSVLVNFLLMITWIPAVIVIIHKASKCCCSQNSCQDDNRCIDWMAKASFKIWGDLVPSLVLRLRGFWIALFLLIGVGSLVVVFATPRLQLPTNHDIKRFTPSHPFEQYREYDDSFRFETDAKATSSRNLHFQVIWGLEGSDNGNHFDPDDHGHLEYHYFDIFSKGNQLWLSSFCHILRNQSFVSEPETTVCYLDMFRNLLEGPCSVAGPPGAPSLSIQPCCMTSFPVDTDLAKQCVSLFANLTYGNYRQLANGNQVLGQPVFNTDGDLTLFRYIFNSNVTWTPEYDIIDSLYHSIRTFMKDNIPSAPIGLTRGWFGGLQGYELLFYDMQTSLATGTFSGIGLSLGIGLLVMLLTSLNVLITLYAMFTITLVIATTVAAVVLMGWQLNITESLTITLAVGLSIDFTIHYGVAYKLASAADRRTRVKQTLTSVGSAVAMAALTTFLSGSAIMPGRVLTYQQFGIFLMLAMSISWLYATFFFLPLCSVIGPLDGVGDIQRLFHRCVDKPDAIPRGEIPKKPLPLPSECDSMDFRPVKGREVRYVTDKENFPLDNWGASPNVNRAILVGGDGWKVVTMENNIWRATDEVQYKTVTD